MKTILLSLSMAAGTLLGCSQHLTPGQLPSLVQNSVHVKFPQAKIIEWERTGAHFEAEFDIAGIDHTVLVDTTGQILMQKQDITSAQLPQAITVALQKDYQAYLIDDLEKVEREGQVYYQVELENQNEDLKKVYAATGALAEIAYWD
ncbi:PepSY-like domain-containing protein [Rufibacter glacialis]|uniref:PepSY-like domain-containing protein n=1 Tax=Rufibacter glacialis TaxID=1259555 RepID=A0A5M8QT38_9BACT|nr:PepSY-like domain-containing protein [Rufibacter glacialis]KAA6437643.1 hypothetical protein FOE74_03840 [Rufibacter glacialis]GGK57550.1 hypothetical protein GCM10011405_02080 [Rufibacter glacialis]